MKKTNKPKNQQPHTSTGDQKPPPMTKSKHDHKPEEAITDPRFAKVHSDPRFQRLPTKKTKVAIDSRFKELFTDERFKVSSAKVDKRGKRKGTETENPFRRYYEVEEEDEEEKVKEKVKEKMEKVKEKEEEEVEDEEESEVVERLKKTREMSESEEDDDEEEESDETTTTSSDTDDGEDGGVGVDPDDGASDVEEEIKRIEKETHRLAVVNMDWDYVKAVDLLVLFNSFLPKGGQILSVAVYPTDFGMKRLEEEAVSGPVGLFGDNESDSDIDVDTDDSDDELDAAKVRAYERSRLRYYFAVVECDSSATADYLYKACDGFAFGGMYAYPLDLRFIPDTLELKHEPRDVAKELPTGYEGVDTNTRGESTAPRPSWDEDDQRRARILKRKFNADQLAEQELKEFLASDESEGDEEDESNAAGEGDRYNKYRALLQGNDNQAEDDDEGQDMEVTFNTGLENLSKQILEKKDKKSETVWEAHMRKRKEKRQALKNRSKNSSDDESDDTDQEPPNSEQDDFFEEEPPPKKTKASRIKKEKHPPETDKEAEASKAELELLFTDDNEADTAPKGYKIKPKKAKGTKGKEAVDEEKLPSIDYEDPRFSALFKNPLFALDPTDPQFKRSAAYARQLAQQQQKGREDLTEEESRRLPDPTPNAAQNGDEGSKSDRSSSKDKHELSSLIKSIKMKSKQIIAPSSGKKKGKAK
ncbi:Pre-rRNA-processing protein esf1-like protein [Drosera capensis]